MGSARGKGGDGRAGRSAKGGAGRSPTVRSGGSRSGTSGSRTGGSRTGRSGAGRPAPERPSPGVARGRPRRAGGSRTVDGREERARPQKARGLGGTQVEGRQAVRELLLAGRRKVLEIYLGNEVDRVDIIEDVLELAGELRVPVREVSRSKLDHLSHTDAPQGIVALAQQLPAEELSLLCRRSDGRRPFLLAVDGVTDPGNLGALMRIAECAGVTGVVLPKHRAVHVTPTVTKTAAGAIEYLPMALVGGLPAAIEEMKAAGVWVVGLDMAGQTSVHHLEVAGDGVCLVLGAEGKGLSRLVRQRCDLIASIPLHGRLASLNVASAGAIACYEIARVREAAG